MRPGTLIPMTPGRPTAPSGRHGAPGSGRPVLPLAAVFALVTAALAAVLALLLPGTVASASPLSAPGTRVGVQAPTIVTFVGVHECITAGQRPVRGPSQPQLMVGHCVAAEAGDAGATAGDDLATQCLNSFTADTPVLMAHGKQEPIADVKVGDKVLATDPESGRTEARPVTALIRHSGKHTMVDLTLDDGSKITTTDHRPFWDATTRTFTDAIDLRVGDRVLSDHGRTLAISVEHVYDQDLTAYNLQIDGIHTYYAGNTPVLVHNSCDADVDGLEHAASRHLPGGSEVDRNASLFDPGSNLSELAATTAGRIGRFNPATGNIEYVINSGGVIGTTGNGLTTTTYTVVRSGRTGDLVTLFPGG